jgi:hypothetical protein
MKTVNKNPILIKILFILILFSFTSAHHDTSTPEAYAKELVKVLQKEDVKFFKKFYTTCDELKSSMLESITDSTIKRRFADEFTDEKCQEELNRNYNNRNYNRFEEVIKSGKQLGIKWKKIKYENVEYVIKSGDYGLSSISKTKVLFSFNGNTYYVEIKGLGKLKNGWNAGKIYGPKVVK